MGWSVGIGIRGLMSSSNGRDHASGGNEGADLYLNFIR